MNDLPELKDFAEVYTQDTKGRQEPTGHFCRHDERNARLVRRMIRTGVIPEARPDHKWTVERVCSLDDQSFRILHQERTERTT